MGKSLETKILDGNGAVLKLEIYRSGRTIDGRNITRKEVQEIFNNTKRFILSQNVTIPLKFGHDDKDQTIKGEVVDLELKRKRNKRRLGYEYSLVARIHFRNRAYELFNAGELPNVSAEIAPEGFTEDGSEHGQYLMGVALLGTDVPAIPWLQTQFQHDDSIYYYSYQPGRNLHFQKEKNKMEEKFQVPEEILAAIQTLNDTIAIINDWAMAEPAEDVPPEEEASSEAPVIENSGSTKTEDFDKDQRIKELESELESLKNTEQVESAFAKLHSAGKVKQDDKQIFKALCQSQGVEKALELYSVRTAVKTPPMEPAKKKELSVQTEGWKQYQAKWEEFYKDKLPMNGRNNPERLKALIETAAKAEHLQMNGGGKNGSHR